MKLQTEMTLTQDRTQLRKEEYFESFLCPTHGFFILQMLYSKEEEFNSSQILMT